MGPPGDTGAGGQPQVSTSHASPDRVWLRLGVLALAVFCSSASFAHAEIRVQPREIRLFELRQQQLVVSSSDERSGDATFSAQFTMEDADVANIAPGGLLTATHAGTTTLHVRVGDDEAVVSVIVQPGTEAPPVRFDTEVMPVLTKLGCNGGGCHGKATGQNGFKLSLLGFEPDSDHETLVQETRGRRLLIQAPDHSLLLRKGTAKVPHGGGRRLDESGDDYRILRDWIAQGAQPAWEGAPTVARISVTPGQRILATNSQQQLLVTAHFSDGTSADVTRQAVYEANEPDLAAVSPTGCVTTNHHRGLVAVMARFGEMIATFHAAIPFPADSADNAQIQRQLAELEPQLQHNLCDPYLLQQWQRLGIVPSNVADDATYLRRAMVDICGTLPTEREVQSFRADTRPDKHARLVDELLERPEYSTFFAMKWASILRNRGAGLGSGWQRTETALFKDWVRDALQANLSYDQFVSEILTASGSQVDSPTTVWYRTVRKGPEYVESVAQAFLGVRIQCAQCHHHPADRWSQADYYGLSAAFARVGRKGGFADGEVPTKEIIFLKDEATVRHPRTGEILPPKALGGNVLSVERHVDPRRELAQWMTRSDNPFFARAMVNRMWAHFLGRGLVHPVDDARSTNPPTNPLLLDALAADFVASGYDMKHLIRVITGSYAYRLESMPRGNNAEDTQSYARFYPRRMAAEILLDGISQILDVPTEFPNGADRFPVGTRAIDLPDQNVAATFLDVFGRNSSGSSCQCEGGDLPGLGQALELVNSQEIQRKLTCDGGYAHQLAVGEIPNAIAVQEMFVRVFARLPTDDEQQMATEFMDSATDRREAYRALLWSLFATNEFLFNH